MTVVGVDVGAEHLHCVAIEGADVRAAAVLPAGDPVAAAGWARGAVAVAIDAPAQASTAPHRDDETLAPKFRLARCAEVALGREHGSWVPWVAPPGEAREGWLGAGLRLFDALAAAEIPAIEVFPHGAFRALAGGRLPSKSTPAGLAARARLLRASVDVPSLPLWSHHGLDALVGAVVARDHASGTARRVGCGHDESAIWLPAPARRA